MKKAAIVVLLSSLFFAVASLPGAEKAYNRNSPALSASLERAIATLEGATFNVTAAARPVNPVDMGKLTVITCPTVACPTANGTCEVTCGPTLNGETCVYYLTCFSTFAFVRTCAQSCKGLTQAVCLRLDHLVSGSTSDH